MSENHLWILKNCKDNHHKKCFNTKNSCRCDCHRPSKIESRELNVLAKVGIVPRTFCPDCKFNYEKEHNVCLKCNGNLVIKHPRFKKKQYVDSMGNIESLMHQRTVKERKEKKKREEELTRIYYHGRLKAFDWKVKKPWQIWKNSQSEKELHQAGLNEVHEHLGHTWDPWERKWQN